MALAGEEIGHYLPDQRTAVAVAPGLQFGRRHPQRADDAVIERARGVVPYRFGGERKTQVVPAVAFAGAHRCLPLIGADEGGQAYVPAGFLAGFAQRRLLQRSEEHTSELQSLMRISYAVFCLKKKNNK